jgi:ribosome biogenesis GTPase
VSFSISIESSLARLGFSPFFRSQLPPEFPSERVARVALPHKSRLVVLDGVAPRDAVVSGRLRHQALDPLDLPGVGDWVVLSEESSPELASIERVLTRKTALVRRSAGESHRPQLIAANVDVVLIVAAFSASLEERIRTRGVNLRRIERYLVAVRQSGGRPVVVLNKLDLVGEAAELVEGVERIAGDAPVIATSAWSGDGLERVREQFSEGETLALVGSSGVGKSALTQRLCGSEVGELGDVRSDDERGRHTTTHRELHTLPDGGVLIDTPGMRELGLWLEEGDADTSFDEIQKFAAECRFRDCRHEGEPGCRVREALVRGELDEERLESLDKLNRELAFERRKVDPRARLEQKNGIKRRARALRRKYADRE